MTAIRDELTGRFLKSTTIGTSRVCSRCKVMKPLEEFGTDRKRLAGKAYWCKQCCAGHKALPEVKAHTAARYQERKEELRESRTEYMRKWRAENPERAKEANRKYMARRREDGRQRVYENNRVASDHGYHIEKVLRNRMHVLLRGETNKPSTKALLGCSTKELRKHIEQQWLPGMSWENYGLHGWHIDHIKPVAEFDLLDSEQQKQCFHYTNLRPLWAVDNIRRRWVEERAS